jgi:hypothetical protein
MRRYEKRTRTVEQDVYVEDVCDGCGVSSKLVGLLIEVVISVHEGEDGGGRDQYDFCDDCLVGRAPLLKAAGSTAFLVTGEEDGATE